MDALFRALAERNGPLPPGVRIRMTILNYSRWATLDAPRARDALETVNGCIYGLACGGMPMFAPWINARPP